ncbi:hypothetical protein ABW20_dc0106881 [Dactylellina cionopaga]|nr:hypothetical protein ABW20_dc0106881 [Dactylellina cionopaga]
MLGNHDFGLDSKHPQFLPKAVELFTSDAAKTSGIHYLDREVKTFTDYPATLQSGSKLPELRVYGNPCQPEFIGKPWGVEKVRWEEDGDGIEKSEILSMSPERRFEEGREGPESLSEFVFEQLEEGRDTIFVNAAWMTMKKGPGSPRNKPMVVTLSF